jgi:probable F420-dependent oxidoreductase
VNANHLVNEGGFPAMVRFVRAADALGFDYFRLLDHVLGFVAEKHGEVEKTPYTDKSEFQEVFTFMAYLSALTERIGFITGVLGLPQRQTALVAKQAAQVDIMSGGRLILGVGIGYNPVEFEAMGFSFKDRAGRVEEQIELLRALWTRPVVSFQGTWHTLTDVNINPLPQRSIPIWMGAGRLANPVPPEKVLQRIGKYADGFMPLFRIDEATGKLADDALAGLDLMRRTATEHGRDPAAIELEIGLYPEGKSNDQVFDEISYLSSQGVTHIHARFPNQPIEAQLDFIGGFAEIRDSYRRHHE